MFIRRLAISFAAAAVFVTPSLLPICSAQPQLGVTIGDRICVEGYVMDRFCIDFGTLLDNPGVKTLEGPERHTMHCLIDVSWCVDSGYEVLLDPLPGDDTYCVGYRLDGGGNDMVWNLAAKVGSTKGCRMCEGTHGDIEEGFRALIKGRVTSLGDLDNGKDEPAQIEVEEVMLAGTGDCNDLPTKIPLGAARCARTDSLSSNPTMQRSAGPSRLPSADPTRPPTISRRPSEYPSGAPSEDPTVSPAPSGVPSEMPSGDPTVSAFPSGSPTRLPSGEPSESPSESPTV